MPLLLSAALGCGDDGANAGAPCTEVGATQPCTCATGGSGSRVCGPDLVFGACVCAGVDAGLDGGGVDAGLDAGPPPDAGPPTRVVALSLGNRFSCALLDNGAVRCWGEGLGGALGYGNTDDLGDDETPASAGDVPLGGAVLAISSGATHSCALLAAGTVCCWGGGLDGKLGYGNSNKIGDDETPDSVGPVEIGGTAISVSAGSNHTCALLDTGAVRCRGRAQYGRLGYVNVNDIGDDETPASAGNVVVGGPIVEVNAGATGTCALLTTGAARCWGRGNVGRLGYGNTDDIGDNETPASAGDVPIGALVSHLGRGWNNGALLATGAVRRWGPNGYGGLGYGHTDNIGDDETPASAGDVEVGAPVVQLATGSATCVLTSGGQVLCWGYANEGSLGYGNTDNIGDDETPASVGPIDLGGLATSVASGGGHSCAILTTGAVVCWGYNIEGQLGYGHTDSIGDDETPASAGTVQIF